MKTKYLLSNFHKYNNIINLYKKKFKLKFHMLQIKQKDHVFENTQKLFYL